jgi:hypothetical protein
MLGFYNLFSGHLVKDLFMAPRMLSRGKLSLLPPWNKDVRGVKEIFARAEALEGEPAHRLGSGYGGRRARIVQIDDRSPSVARGEGSDLDRESG